MLHKLLILRCKQMWVPNQIGVHSVTDFCRRLISEGNLEIIETLTGRIRRIGITIGTNLTQCQLLKVKSLIKFFLIQRWDGRIQQQQQQVKFRSLDLEYKFKIAWCLCLLDVEWISLAIITTIIRESTEVKDSILIQCHNILNSRIIAFHNPTSHFYIWPKCLPDTLSTSSWRECSPGSIWKPSRPWTN